jgi:Cu-processing system permease protein
MDQIYRIVKFEVSRLVKNRWLLAFALLFTLLNLVLFFISSGNKVDRGYDRFVSTLNNMIIILAPLMGLVLSSQTIAGDRSDKFLALLKTYPLRPTQYVLGKYLGLFVLSTASIIIGFLIVTFAGLAAGQSLPGSNVLVFIVLTISLFFIFISWGTYIGMNVKNRLSALTSSLIIWFFLVFIYELLIWYLLPKITYGFQKITLLVLLIINPVESLRIISVFLQRQGSIYGADFYYWELNFNTIQGYVAALFLILAYAALPLFLAILKLKNGKDY